MNTYRVYIYSMEQGEVVSYDMHHIKAENKDIAWNRAIYMAFDDSFANNKMVTVNQIDVF